jgi:DNA-directed RNA polymerase alpha subunit
MAQTTGDEPKNDFPPGLAQPALRALSAAGYTRLDQFTRVTEADLLKLHGMGPKALGLIRSALHARGLSFADSDKG